MQPIANAIGCFWMMAAAKLALTTASDENSRLDLGPTGCIPCFAGPRGERKGMSEGVARRNPGEEGNHAWTLVRPAAFHALQGPAASGKGCGRPKAGQIPVRKA